jgi:hypothetical protein
MTHGFAKATSFSVACGLYFWTTMIILKNFSLVKDLFNQDQYLTLRDPSGREKVLAVLSGGTVLKTLEEVVKLTVVPEKFHMDTFMEFGFHMSPFKIRENGVFVNPNVTSLEKGTAEDVLCMRINIIHAQVNKLMGTNFKIDYDFGTLWDDKKPGDGSVIRQCVKKISIMKKAIENCLPNQKQRFLARPIPNSSNIGSAAKIGKPLF